MRSHDEINVRDADARSGLEPALQAANLDAVTPTADSTPASSTEEVTESAEKPAKLKFDGMAIASFVIVLMGGVIVSMILAMAAHSRINNGKRRGINLVYATYALNAIWILLILAFA